AEHFAADTGLDRLPAGHHAAGRRQDARAQAGQHIRHLVAAEVHAPAGTADALDTGDNALAAGTVLEEQPKLPPHSVVLPCLEHLEALDISLVLQNLGDLHLQPGRRHVHAVVTV